MLKIWKVSLSQLIILTNNNCVWLFWYLLSTAASFCMQSYSLCLTSLTTPSYYRISTPTSTHIRWVGYNLIICFLLKRHQVRAHQPLFLHVWSNSGWSGALKGTLVLYGLHKYRRKLYYFVFMCHWAHRKKDMLLLYLLNHYPWLLLHALYLPSPWSQCYCLSSQVPYNVAT